jgi:hypothetical protein
MSPRESRLARNEELFRAVNDRIAELSGDYEDRLALVCECATLGCTTLLSISVTEYERVHGREGWFVVVPGHVDPKEKVVERRDGYDIVEKHFDQDP